MRRAALHNLGCKVNAYETEAMQQILEKAGYEIVPFQEQAEVYVINTCSVTNMADRKSRQMIHRARKQNPDAVIVAAGCYVQTAGERQEEDETIDIVIGNNKKHELAERLEEFFEKHEKARAMIDINCQKEGYEELSLSRTAEHTRAFIKVQDGCNQFCTYCIIPSLRGPYRSVPMERLLTEAGQLAGQGVKELILVAQETTLYGTDLYGKKMLPELLRRLAEIPGIEWLRVQYCYPEEITEELVQVIKEEEKVCHYLDIPIQHASDRILKSMGRKTSREELKERIARLREEIPDIVLRTTLISGFPGETPQDHEELMEFVDEMEFDRLGVFAYSAEEDTPAASFSDQVPEEVRAERRDELMELQQDIAFEKAENMVGRILEVMIEGKVADENAFVGRTYMDAPGVDGLIFVNADVPLMSGDFCRVRVTGAADYDLIGEMIDEFAE